MRRMSACMQPLIGTSIRRYLPPIGTAGFDRVAVRGKSLEPWPPPRMIASVSLITMRIVQSEEPVVEPGLAGAACSGAFERPREVETAEQLWGDAETDQRRSHFPSPRRQPCTPQRITRGRELTA